MARKRPRLKAPEPIGQIIAGRAFRGRGNSLVSIYQLRKSWRSLVGETLAECTAPKTIQNQTLVISVENSAWAHHLSMMKDELIPILSERVKIAFKDLRFVNEAISKVPHTEKLVPEKTKVEEVKNQDANLQEILARVYDRLVELRNRS